MLYHFFGCGFLAIKVIKHSVCPLSKYTVIGYARVPSSLPSPSHTHTRTFIYTHPHTHNTNPLCYCYCPTTLLRSWWYVYIYTCTYVQRWFSDCLKKSRCLVTLLKGQLSLRQRMLITSLRAVKWSIHVLRAYIV